MTNHDAIEFHKSNPSFDSSIRNTLTDVPPVVTSVVPARAVGRGRVTINGSGFDIGESCEVLLGDVPARISFASSRRIVITIPDEMDGGRAPVLLGDTTLRPRLDRSDLGDRPSPGRQSGLRSRRQSLRHLQRIARAGSAGLDLPRHAGGHARAVRRRASSTRRRWRSGRTASSMCRAASRAPSIASPTTARPSRSRPISASPAASRSTTTDGCSSATVRARSSACATAARRAFATLPPSVAAFHLAMSPAGELLRDGADARHVRPVYRIDRHARTVTTIAVVARPAAGARVWSRRHAVRRRCAGRVERPVSARDATARSRTSLRAGRSLASRSGRAASWSSRRTTPPTDSTDHEPQRRREVLRPVHRGLIARMSQLFARKPIADLQPDSTARMR